VTVPYPASFLYDPVATPTGFYAQDYADWEEGVVIQRGGL
jgi:hypothetical protein